MKIYTIIGGVNGTGKSSLTGVLKTQTTDLGVIIDVDKIAAQRGGHNIREEDVQRRFAGRWEAVSKILPYCDEAHFLTTITVLQRWRSTSTAS